MTYEDLITDHAQRTLINLDLVTQVANDGHRHAYPVTQLWNSLLGLIVAPRETDVRRLPDIQLVRLRALGWPSITTAGSLQADTLRGLVSTLRNAVAHFNVGFHGNEKEGIREVSLWNVPAADMHLPCPDQRHSWDGRLTVSELDNLARRIAATYVDNLGARGVA